MTSESPKKNPNEYVRYSGIGFQMLAIILIGTLAGRKLDSYLQFKIPIMTLLLILISVAMAIYIVIREVSQKK